ncbi:methyltransferase domain-containing protein [Actinopolymorpha sp. NPDC004070]|uniref:methyltransferase domain-containing protein n=1 Tax=Actinopolymorpha sp. NPDC004070 TaxID=3154548 RepID=UPI0033A58A93
MTTVKWNADLYDGKHGFVAARGGEALDLLDAQPGERVLDVGSGTGDHVAALRARGVDAIGVDASPEMVARAREKYPDHPFEVADVCALDYHAEFDAVFSNATLHWVTDQVAATESIARALRPGGRFVTEFGGHGNIAKIEVGVGLTRVGLDISSTGRRWYFPTIGEYAFLLEDRGELQVDAAWLFDRPTPLEGPDGLANWVRMFYSDLIAEVPDQAAFFAKLEETMRRSLYRDGRWWIDYRRIRVHATKPVF